MNSSSVKIIHKPIIVGTHAAFLGKKQNETRTHKWCCYVRAPMPIPFAQEQPAGFNFTQHNKQALSFISQVEFQLDESFPEPQITLTQPPFEIHQAGWGEFLIGLRISFVDDTIPPVELYKKLVLFDGMPVSIKRPVIREEYDELVFVDPSQPMMQALQVSDTQNDQASNAGQELDSTTFANNQNAIEQAQQLEEQKQEEQKNLKAIDRNIERGCLEKGYKDKDFEMKERQSLEQLQQAVEFVKEQVMFKRQKLNDIDQQIREENYKTKAMKENMLRIV